MKILHFALIWLWAVPALAATGDILYVQSGAGNLREGPSTSKAVVLVLKKGHKLLEIQRQGKWIEVGADRTGGKMGWIHASLVGGKFMGGSTKAPKNDAYTRFKSAFNDLKNRVYAQSRVVLFTDSKDLGDGIVQVTATDAWMKAPITDKENSLRTLFQLWDAAEKSGLPIAVHVVDKQGKQLMSMKR